MDKVKIALIDSGIGIGQETFCKSVTTLLEDEYIYDNIGHGSAILYILNKYCDAEIYVYKIFNNDEEINEEILIDLLQMLLQENKVNIINISLGVTVSNRRNDMEDICKRLHENGIILVSAFDNDGAISYPAAFKTVIGVDTSSRCRLINEYEYVESGPINIRGYDGEQRLPLPDGSFQVFSGTSFVAPLISAYIAKIMCKGIRKFEDICEELKSGAVYIQKNKETSRHNNSFIPFKNAVVFPVNKEIHSLLLNEDLISFNIYKICDSKFFGTVGKKLSEVLNNRNVNEDYIINSIEKLDWEEDFDGFVLGHTRELNETVHFNYKEYIVEKCKQHNKILYSFDDIRGLDSYDEESMTFPYICEEYVPKNQFGKLFRVHCPVIGIMGTSSRQGKYTLQLKLRRHFIQTGYKIAQLGTEPTSLLLGMDEVYPMGYDSICLNDGNSAVLTINKLMNKIAADDIDVILFGSQSQSAPYSIQNLCMIPFNSINLLLGCQPDIVILCVNTCDDDFYIERTVKLIEGLVPTKVEALAISPVLRTINTTLSRKVQFIDKVTLENFKQHLDDVFKIRTFIMNNDCKDIFDYCIDVLSE